MLITYLPKNYTKHTEKKNYINLLRYQFHIVYYISCKSCIYKENDLTHC